jgi:hypothetical protein
MFLLRCDSLVSLGGAVAARRPSLSSDRSDCHGLDLTLFGCSSCCISPLAADKGETRDSGMSLSLDLSFSNSSGKDSIRSLTGDELRDPRLLRIGCDTMPMISLCIAEFELREDIRDVLSRLLAAATLSLTPLCDIGRWLEEEEDGGNGADEDGPVSGRPGDGTNDVAGLPACKELKLSFLAWDVFTESIMRVSKELDPSSSSMTSISRWRSRSR